MLINTTFSTILLILVQIIAKTQFYIEVESSVIRSRRYMPMNSWDHESLCHRRTGSQKDGHDNRKFFPSKYILTNSHTFRNQQRVHYVAREATTSEEQDRCRREVPTNQEQKKQERKQIQYLTRFGNLPTSSGQGRERFY